MSKSERLILIKIISERLQEERNEDNAEEKNLDFDGDKTYTEYTIGENS